MPPRKRNNKVIRKNLAATHKNIRDKNVIQTVKVTVTQPKAQSKKAVPRRRRNPRADPVKGEMLVASNRMPQSSGFSIYNAPPPGNDRYLPAGAITSLLEVLKGKSPEPAQPSEGLVSTAVTRPGTSGLGRYMASGDPSHYGEGGAPDSPIYNSPPTRESAGVPPTTVTRILTDAERLRTWLVRNAPSIPTTATYRTLSQQIDRVTNLRDINALMRLRAETQDNIRRRGGREDLPLNTTPADFERFDDRPPLGAAVGGQRLNFGDYSSDTPTPTPAVF